MSKINQRQNSTTRLINNPKDKFKSLFETAPVALVEGVWGKSFDVFSVNQSALNLFYAGTKIQFTDGFNNLLAKIPGKILLELLSARLKGDLFEAEFRMRTLRHNFIHVCMRLAYMPATDMGPQHVLVSFHDITNYKRQETFLKKLSQIDGLTQLLNQSTVFNRLDLELARARRYHVDLSCIIFDLDGFKHVNDAFGHLLGDQCIKRAARVLKEALRKTDIIGRYGGDEFLAILPETKFEQAIVPVKRFLKMYEGKADIKHNNHLIKTSFSVGISGFPAKGIESGHDLIKAADQALYLSKTAGGNCFHLFAGNTAVNPSPWPC